MVLSDSTYIGARYAMREQDGMQIFLQSNINTLCLMATTVGPCIGKQRSLLLALELFRKRKF